ncbi:MAG: hypothetical protein K2P81_04990 [Bacteriovoracaceae bacterium]|nr:hypothetical protein [Bacteriovoracaceae bacterium]
MSLLVFFSQKECARYSVSERRLDLFYFIVFSIQTFFLAALPSGFHAPSKEGWLGYSISLIYFFLFYPLYYVKFYRMNNLGFLREAIVFSVSSRFASFFWVALMATAHNLLVFGFKLKNLEPSSPSLLYYLIYYGLFSFFMFKTKKTALQLSERMDSQIKKHR